MIGQGIYRLLKAMVFKERSVHILALSFSLGVYIAFSPFIGLHTIMIFFLSWLLSLNIAVTFMATYLINNPCTMIPVYSSGYFFVDWMLSSIFGVDTIASNPAWMSYINEPIIQCTGIQGVSFWALLTGGNVLGVGLALVLYPIMKKVFGRIVVRVYP